MMNLVLVMVCEKYTFDDTDLLKPHRIFHNILKVEQNKDLIKICHFQMSMFSFYIILIIAKDYTLTEPVKGVLKSFANFTGEHLWRSIFLLNLHLYRSIFRPKSCNFI